MEGKFETSKNDFILRLAGYRKFVNDRVLGGYFDVNYIIALKLACILGALLRACQQYVFCMREEIAF